MEKIIASGTFDRLHKGHKLFLKTAFEKGYVLIGLTSDEMVRSKNNAEKIWSFEKRRRKIVAFLQSLGFKEGENYQIIRINDPYGFSLEKEADYILVTDETYENAVKINEKRKETGLHELEIVKVPLVKDAQGTISSTRLRS